MSSDRRSSRNSPETANNRFVFLYNLLFYPKGRFFVIYWYQGNLAMGHEKEIQENGEIAAIEHMMMEFMKTRDAIINKIDTLKPLTTKEKNKPRLCCSL